jgi:hypothetical protein
MKIIGYDPELDEMLYNPESNEKILSFADIESGQALNEEANTLIGYCLSGYFEETQFKDAKLQQAWDELVPQLEELEYNEAEAAVDQFFEEYKNSEWVVYKSNVSGLEGPDPFLTWFVVSADTVYMVDPEFIY